MGGGHYVSACRDEEPLLRWLMDNNESILPPPLGKQWYTFNDNFVNPISETEVKSSSAYILCYIRQDVRAKNVMNLHNQFLASHLLRCPLNSTDESLKPKTLNELELEKIVNESSRSSLANSMIGGSKRVLAAATDGLWNIQKLGNASVEDTERIDKNDTNENNDINQCVIS